MSVKKTFKTLEKALESNTENKLCGQAVLRILPINQIGKNPKFTEHLEY
jgi:hypothetical protein